MNERDLARFWSKVDQSGGPDACWPWLGCTGRNGYGRFRTTTTHIYAHRTSLRLCVGDPPPDLPLATHSCRNRKCCNPKHLSWGDYRTNQLDRARDGTDIRGTKNHSARFSESDIREILRRYDDGESLTSIARHFGTVKSTISMISSGRSWEWMTGRKIEHQRKYQEKP